MTEQTKSRWTWMVPLGLLIGLVLAYFVWPAYQNFVQDAYEVFSSGDHTRIQEWVRGFGAWGFVVLLGLMLLQTILAFLPSLLLMVVAVLSYGPFLGGFLAWGGMLLAASLGYGIGRAVGVAAVDRLIGQNTEKKIARFVDRYGVWGVVAGRVSPALSTDAVSIVAGMVRMGYFPFIAATAGGTLPLTVLVAWLGADVERMQTGLIWVSVISLLIFAGYVIYDRRKRKEGG